MANRKRKEPQVILYKSWLAMFLALDHDQNGQILEAITHHVICGHDIEVSETIRPLVESVLSEIDVNMTQYLDRCETNKRIADQREHERATNVTRTCNERDTIVSPEMHVINTNTNTNTNITLSNDKENVSNDTSKKNFSLLVDEVLDSVELFKNNDDLKDAFKDYLEMRKQIKKPIKTKRALKLNLDDAIKFGNGDHDQTLEVINASIKHSWQGIYSLDNKKTKDDELMETIMNFGGDDIGE